MPKISIVMPVYNGASFLEKGINSVKNQTFEDWELIIVDDESNDNSKELIDNFTSDISDKVKYKFQKNLGGFGARNTGLDLATGDYIAFFDCDDEWYPHHLKNCYEALEKYPEITWVFGANRIIDLTQGGKEVAASTLYNDSTPKSVLDLKREKLGNLNLITDEDVIVCQILDGLYCGQQFSLIRKSVFEKYRFRSSYRNEGADQVALITALSKGAKLGYFENLHGTYCIHGSNASAGCKGATLDKYLMLRNALIRGFEEMREEISLNQKENKALNKRIAQEYFWQIGYNLYLKNGHTKEAIISFMKGIKKYPSEIRFWKTLIITQIRYILRLKQF